MEVKKIKIIMNHQRVMNLVPKKMKKKLMKKKIIIVKKIKIEIKEKQHNK